MDCVIFSSPKFYSWTQ